MVRWLLDEGGNEGIDLRRRNGKSSATAYGADRADGLDEPFMRLSIPASLKRTGNEMKFIIDGVANSAPADATLIRLILRGRKIGKRMFAPGCPTIEDIAAEESARSIVSSMSTFPSRERVRSPKTRRRRNESPPYRAVRDARTAEYCFRDLAARTAPNPPRIRLSERPKNASSADPGKLGRLWRHEVQITK